MEVQNKFIGYISLPLELMQTNCGGKKMVLGGTKKPSRRSKVKTLEEALKKESEKSSEYLNRLKYLQADFENYRKRVDKEVREIAQLSKEIQRLSSRPSRA